MPIRNRPFWRRTCAKSQKPVPTRTHGSTMVMASSHGDMWKPSGSNLSSPVRKGLILLAQSHDVGEDVVRDRDSHLAADDARGPEVDAAPDARVLVAQSRGGTALVRLREPGEVRRAHDEG